MKDEAEEMKEDNVVGSGEHRKKRGTIHELNENTRDV